MFFNKKNQFNKNGLDKPTRLVAASLILFWFGVIWQFFTLVKYPLEYHLHGTFEGYELGVIFYDKLYGMGYFTYHVFFHIIHIIAGYWLSKGKVKGVILGLFISSYEIIDFFTPDINPVLYTPEGITIRILFAIVIYLIISGRKELVALQNANWRPWKNPKTIP